jgi:hypothetical protein
MLRTQRIIKEAKPSAPSNPPKPATPNQTKTGLELAKKRIEEYKKSLTADILKEIDKILPGKDGAFQINYKDKSIRDVWPSGRFQRTSGTDGSKYMGTYNNDWISADDSAKQTYDKFGDKAWLSAEEKTELGIKWNENTKKYEKINQSNPKPDNTQTSNKLTYDVCPEETPVKKFCKNQIVRDIQRCLRDKHQMTLKDDGKFGPETEKALMKLGLKGDVITAKEYIRACPPTDTGQSSKPNTTGYEDYTNDEYEVDLSDRPEQEYSTGYEDYNLEEN